MSRPPLPRDAEGNIIREKTPIIPNVSKEENNYTVTLNILLANSTDTYSIVAPSIIEALRQMNPTHWGKGVSNLVVEYQGKKKIVPLRLTPHKLKMIFAKKNLMEFFVKKIKTRI